jgi:CDP-glucose 4,6-dehydratase
MTDLAWYKGKKVFITGHTGFKGTWLVNILREAGAAVTGYALPPAPGSSLFAQTKTAQTMISVSSDIRDRKALVKAVSDCQPDIVFHLAAQPLVRQSYREPAETYETNIMGTVNILEAVRATDSVRSFVNVTTDKVYENREWCWGYRENENLCGFDPYSNSKSCSELVTYSYRNSFFSTSGSAAISTARSGNVIGGGDYAQDRIIPDCVRAATAGDKITVRNPHSTRPYQHVLECLSGYLLLAARQYESPALAGSYNFGPDDTSCITTGELVDLFCSYWTDSRWTTAVDGGPHEANFLKLDCSKAKSVLGWKPLWDISVAVEKTVEFSRCLDDETRSHCMINQIHAYFNL